MEENQIKRERNNGITLIALVITIIVLLILAGITIATLTGENGILSQAMKAKEKTEEASKKEEEDLNEMIYIMTGEDTSGANYPVMKEGMKKVYWKEDGTEEKEGEEGFEISKWYSYEVTDDGDMTHGGTDTWNEETQEWGKSHWANAILDENYYVWIPRYCYKIYDNSEEEGYEEYTTQGEGKSYRIDVKFLSGTSNQAPEGYTVHPAFKFGGQELEGIWVGKYETSNDGSDNAKIIPNAISWTKINVATMFEKAQALGKTNIDAHMMKNIEWGAVAYLTQSQYGRNGTEISVNQCRDMYTGAGRGGTDTDNIIWNSTTYTRDNISDSQKYNGKIGKLSSTTGNVYGVYDMSGGTNEYVMGFYTPDGINLGYSGFSTFMPDSKYYDLYINKTSDDESNIGDALYETKGWNSDNSYFVYSSNPVFIRGGNFDFPDSDGSFCFNNRDGDANPYYGFRVCLTVK